MLPRRTIRQSPHRFLIDDITFIVRALSTFRNAEKSGARAVSAAPRSHHMRGAAPAASVEEDVDASNNFETFSPIARVHAFSSSHPRLGPAPAPQLIDPRRVAPTTHHAL